MIASDIYRIFIKNVVKIYSTRGSGSGLILDPKTIITAYHVTEGSTDVKVKNVDLNFKAKVGINEPKQDLSILSPVEEIPELEPITICENCNYSIGDAVVILGYPLGSEILTLHQGNISAIGHAKDFPAGKLRIHEFDCPLIQVDATINEGFSGGPVFHMDSGCFLGFVTTKYGIVSDYLQLRSEIQKLLDDPSIQKIGQNQSGVSIDGIHFGRLCNFLFQSLNSILKSMQVLHVGIGYIIDSNILKDYLKQ